MCEEENKEENCKHCVVNNCPEREHQPSHDWREYT